MEEKKPETKSGKDGKTLRAVYGRMVDVTTGEEFGTNPQPYKEITPWMQAQVDAGKLELL